MTTDLFFHIVSRFLHIASVVLLLGGVAFARFVNTPAASVLAEPQRVELSGAAQRIFRPILFTLLTLIVFTGLYNYFTYAGPKHTPTYQMWFGFKFLLVLHILATSILWATAPMRDTAAEAKGSRRLLSLAISGFVIVLISAYLRSLSQRGL